MELSSKCFRNHYQTSYYCIMGQQSVRDLCDLVVCGLHYTSKSESGEVRGKPSGVERVYIERNVMDVESGLDMLPVLS